MEKITVLIRVTRKTEYASNVEMTRQEYDRLDSMLKAGGKEEDKAEKELNKLIDVNDWQDDELDRLDEFEIVEEDDKEPENSES